MTKSEGKKQPKTKKTAKAKEVVIVKKPKNIQGIGNKIRLLRIWEILKTESDGDHPISTKDLIDRLKKEGLKSDRRTIYDDIKLLNEYGYEILCTRSALNQYYVADRDFDVPEIQILIDAVQAASFITEKKTDLLVTKLARLAGSAKGEVLKRNLVQFSTVKGRNESIYYSVNEISTAINEKKQVSFYYFDLGLDGEKEYRMQKKDPEKRFWYRLTPIATIFHDDNYYLVAYSDYYKKTSHYRIDRMDEVEVYEKPASSDVEDFDLAGYKRSTFAMFGGKIVHLIVEAEKSVMGALYDKFGERVKAEISGDKVMCEIDVQVGNPLLIWLIGFGDKLKVKGPDEVCEEIKRMIEGFNKVYLN